jgi:protein O-mannosyl-transferase
VAAAVAFAVYAPSLAGGFLYDDTVVIVLNPAIRDLRALGTVLRSEPARPLLNLTWALNYAAGGAAPWHYHLVNVLIHAANAALLASLFLWMARRLGRPQAEPSALLGACLFAASPMAAETVAYVSSRSSALTALFALGSLRAAGDVLTGARRPGARAALAIALFLLALGTKEEAAAVPLLLLLLDYFFVAGREPVAGRWRWALHASLLGLLAAGVAARRLATGTWLPPQAPIAPGLYLLTQWAAFPLYFLRALVPLDPSLYRDHAAASWPPAGSTILWSAASLGLCLGAVSWRRRRPEWSFAVACLAAGLLPSSSVVALNDMVADHRAYLGSVGIAFALGGALWKVGGARLGVLVLLVLGARSAWYEWVLADPVRAWEHVVERAPSAPDALSALGESYAQRHDPRAEAMFRRAAALVPGNPRYWANLGLYYSEHDRLPEAVEPLRRAVEAAPHDGVIRNYLGRVLVGLGRDDEALREFEAALAAEPGFAQTYLDLATLVLERGQPERARSLLQAASRLPLLPEEGDRIVALQRRLP